MEKEIKISIKLQECRDTAKRFYGNEYEETLKPYLHIIKAVKACNKIETLPALLKISTTNTYQDNAMGQMLFMAAAVELIVCEEGVEA